MNARMEKETEMAPTMKLLDKLGTVGMQVVGCLKMANQIGLGLYGEKFVAELAAKCDHGRDTDTETSCLDDEIEDIALAADYMSAVLFEILERLA